MAARKPQTEQPSANTTEEVRPDSSGEIPFLLNKVKQLEQRIDELAGRRSDPVQMADFSAQMALAMDRMDRRGHQKKFRITRPYELDRTVNGVPQKVVVTDVETFIGGESVEDVTRRLKDLISITKEGGFPYVVEEVEEKPNQPATWEQALSET